MDARARNRPIRVLLAFLLLSASACAGATSGDDTAGFDEAGAATEPSVADGTTEPQEGGGDDGGNATPTASDASPTDPQGTLPEALSFTAPLVGGGTFDGADYAGRQLALWFWAPW